MSAITKPNRVDDSYSNPTVHLRDNCYNPDSLLSNKDTKDNLVIKKLSNPPTKQSVPGSRQSTDANSIQNATNQVPFCLIKLVRSIVRSFYSREHSLIVDMLVRNTIMKEDDLCERLQFERRQLRQFLHALKLDQFIKSKIQLETDAEGKTTKITHYFIDYKLFVNVVKYRLDQMQRRLEAEQRQSTSRASFKCTSCNTTYTDLEVDRLIDLSNPGKLACVYCRHEVIEEEDNALRTDARALIAKFHHQVRDPIDLMLRECDVIHLSQSILEPEIRPLEPLLDKSDRTSEMLMQNGSALDSSKQNEPKRNESYFGMPESSIRIVLIGNSDQPTQVVKERPVWMADSTVGLNSGNAFGQIERSSKTSNTIDSSHSNDSITQTLAPGRVPTGFSTSSSAGTSSLSKHGADASDSATSGDIMQLLLIHERRQPNHSFKNSNSGKSTQKANTDSHPEPKNADSKPTKESHFNVDSKVKIGSRTMAYGHITPAIIETMTSTERADYIRIGKQMYKSMMMD